MTPTSRRLIYLVGQPGAGKTTLMTKLTEDYTRVFTTDPVPHDRLVNLDTGAVMGAEIGRRRPNFGGTDALASTIIDKAAPWLRTRPYTTLYAEGARLANKRFLETALDAGYSITLGLLDHEFADQWRTNRERRLNRVQNAAWVDGRRTASINLAEHMAELGQRGYPVRVMSGHPDALYPDLRAAARGLSRV